RMPNRQESGPGVSEHFVNPVTRRADDLLKIGGGSHIIDRRALSTCEFETQMKYQKLDRF
ncbi:MAG: hypothetical protein JSU96_05580, partial [Acidobacteriota bacterium]